VAIVPSCAIASASRARFLPKASSTFARGRAQHSEAAVIDQRYSPNLVEEGFSELRGCRVLFYEYLLHGMLGNYVSNEIP
jgi:hypothetical protein